ncbi:uncharacterized protein N7482_009469 [Penicillium canariense]|uniref:DUF1275 domain protein n=1 Tax=Penicillium canariense TaxID=189055 RepID=A0A9W9LEW4_9EURO|nr:uncharacterized protein N7482_009469 [Penicillium canariense]KAJ5152991.1 hypothetical protein N7482_009469 [Penicillium canariense]
MRREEYLDMASTLPSPNAPQNRSHLWDFFMEDIREDLLLECELLLLSFATGIQDAAAWPDYTCFASNQTGNTLFLAIGVAGLTNNAYSFPNIGVSLSLFVAGGLVMGQLGNYVGVRRRLWLLISNLIQTTLVFCALIIQYSWPIRRDGPAAMAVIACLAFSGGAQVAMSRSLKMTEITTAMATAAFIDVVVDPKLGKLRNRLRNRRVMFLVMLTAGCFVGAFAQREVGSHFPLLLCAIGKVMVSGAFLFNRPIVKEEEEEEDVKA